MVVSDAMGNWLKCFATLAVMVTLVYGRPYAADRHMLVGGELFTLSLLSLLGMFVMISGNNFLVIYLGLELLTLSSYALVALRRDNGNATEAAMKYFVLGALASGFLLYGLSMLYGATGTLDLTAVFAAVGTGLIKHQVLVLGLVFVVCGIAFKLGAAPFHMWVPDVYQGAPTAVTLMIAGAPKLAAAPGYRLATNDGGVGHGHLVGGQLHGHCPNQFEAHAGLFHHRANGFCVHWHVVGRHQWQHLVRSQRLQLGHVLHGHLCAHHFGCVRRHFAVGA
jgi:hypothetical protein